VKILYPDGFSAAYGIGPLDWGPGITFRPLHVSFASFVTRFPYVLGVGMLLSALKERPFAFHAHDLSTSVIALAAARFRGCYCVCDFHEWYSENVTWDEATKTFRPHSSLARRTYALVEKLVLWRATAVVTVCDSIAHGLRTMRRTPREVTVVRNIPPVSALLPTSDRESPLRRQLGLRDDAFLLLYQGGTGPSRLLEPIIEAMKLAPRAVLAIRGPGIETYGKDYLEVAASHGVVDRVRCLPPVPSNMVVEAAAEADAGIWTLPNLCKNFSYALPNKLFEYLAAGLPVLAADYPETARIVTGYEVGLTFDPYSPQSIAASLNRLIEDSVLRARFADNARAALEDMRADREWHKLVALYEGLASGGAPAAPPVLAGPA
jgi:glycosyltransferase involved in cell wall biosynthesis